CIYPRPKHLKTAVNRMQYDGEPYRLYLALGEPQLAYRSFDLSVLEFYRNDPRYSYENDDVRGKICHNSDGLQGSDRIFLQTFGFSYDDNLNRAVAVFLGYLSNLSPEHQLIWQAKELQGDFKLHPDYYRNAIIGDWGERVPICGAFLKELYIINRMAEAMARPPLFHQDFGEYGENKPQRFGFLIRTTLEEFNNFVLLLDKMLSDNINKEFFQNEVSYEREIQRKDGRIEIQNKWTLQILDEWIRKYFSTDDDWDKWDRSLKALRKLRKMRQKPAHAIDENIFDQRYFKEQRELIIGVYSAINILRLLLENHPKVEAANIEVPDWLRDGKIWTQ
ncbi:AAA family ATPase, partial [bacterium]|nr:AAA family ATPase [bacterium]